MGFIVAILITLAVMGSILWVMPSPREKRIIAMRQKAMSLGLKVRLLDQQLAGKFFPWCENHRQFVLYERYFQNENKDARQSIVVRLSEGYVPHELDEQPIKHKLQALGLLDKLPKSTEALVFYTGAVSVLWTEKEGLEVIDDLAESLAGCAEAVQKNSLF